MKSKTAKKILDLQIKKLSNEENLFDDVWFYQTKSYVRDMLGDDSIEYQQIFRLVHFTDSYFHYSAGNYANINPNDVIHYQERIIKMLNACKETISHKGLYKPPNRNFLQKFSDTTLAWVIPLTLSGIVAISIAFGQRMSNVQNIKLEQENKLLKDSLYHISESYELPIAPDKVSDTIRKKEQ